jgi:GH24 family phage-related lysozyme (muramidase)
VPFPNLSKNVSKGNHIGVAKEKIDITNGGVKGLVKRRRTENRMYNKSDYSGKP